VPDGELDEVERAGLPEVAEREDGGEDRLQSGILALLGEEVHLQEAVVRLALHVDEIRQRHVAANLREVVANRLLFRHRSVHSDGSFWTKTRPPRGVTSAATANSNPLCPALNEVKWRDPAQATREADSQGLEPCGEGRSPLLRFRRSQQQKRIPGCVIP